jgi:hypothetical protein
MRCHLVTIPYVVDCAALFAELERWQREKCKAGPYKCPHLGVDSICLEEITLA